MLCSSVPQRACNIWKSVISSICQDSKTDQDRGPHKALRSYNNIKEDNTKPLLGLLFSVVWQILKQERSSGRQPMRLCLHLSQMLFKITLTIHLKKKKPFVCNVNTRIVGSHLWSFSGLVKKKEQI